MLTEDVKVNKRYRTRDGREIVVIRAEPWSDTYHKHTTYVVNYDVPGHSYPACVFGDGPGRGTGYLDRRQEMGYDLIEELDVYEQTQLSLFE